MASASLDRTGLLGQAEIEQLDSLLGDQNVGGLQIAMGDPLPVRGIQGIQNLSGVFDGFFERQRSFQRRALDVFHHQVIRADIVELADVGMIQLRDGAGFTLEAFAEVRLCNFDRDEAIEARVAGFVNLAHATLAYESEDFVGAEFITYRKRHTK